MSDVLTVLERTAQSSDISLPQEHLLRVFILASVFIICHMTKLCRPFPIPFSLLFESGPVNIVGTSVGNTSPFCPSSSED